MMVRAYRKQDIPAMISIWNEVVEEGIAFPQEELLEKKTGAAFLRNKVFAAWRRKKKAGKFWDYIFCIQTMWEDAGTSAMQATR